VDPRTFLLSSLIVTTGAALQGSVGFGLGLFSVPLLLLFAPELVPGPLLAASIVLTMLLAHGERGAIAWNDLGWALAGRIPGIVAAAALLAVISQNSIGLWSGILVLLAVGLSASGLHVPLNRRSLVAAGVLSGLLGTAVSIGGPPIALLYQREPGPRLRGTLSAFFLIGVALSLVGLAAADRFGIVELRLAAYLVPGIVVGFFVSRRAAGFLDRGYTRPAILIISALSSLVVLLRALW
jgi:hypothetical protein